MIATWAILWDMDGVLVDSARLHYQSWLEILTRHHIPFTKEMFSQVFEKNNTQIIQELISSPGEDLIRIIDQEKEANFRANIPSNARIFEGVMPWLTRFKDWGFPQAVASSAPQANLDALVDAFEIRPFFQAIISGQHLPSKPNPAVFVKAAKSLNIPISRCVVIEDSIHGITGARQAGMKTIGVATSQPLQALNQADLVVQRLADLTPHQVKTLLSL